MIILFFDAAPLLLALCVIIFALVGLLESALPVLIVIFWVLFGLVCIFAVIYVLGDETSEGMVGRKIVNMVITLATLVILGLEMNGFFVSVTEAAAMGGFTGMLEFVLRIIFNGMGFLIVATILGAASGWLCSDETDVSWGVRVAVNVGLLIAYFVLGAFA